MFSECIFFSPVSLTHSLRPLFDGFSFVNRIRKSHSDSGVPPFYFIVRIVTDVAMLNMFCTFFFSRIKLCVRENSFSIFFFFKTIAKWWSKKQPNLVQGGDWISMSLFSHCFSKNK